MEPQTKSATTLSDSQKGNIKHRLSLSEKVSTLAKEFNVSTATIYRLKREKDDPERPGTSSSLVRKPQTNLSIKRKQEILEKLDAGHDVIKLASEYSVSEWTIRRIKKKKVDILKSINNLTEVHGSLDRKKMCGIVDGPLDKAVYAWFTQKRSLGEPISGDMLRTKAIELDDKINGPDTRFRASNGWIEKFKKRYGIRQVSFQGEKQSADLTSAENFKSSFSTFIQENNYDLDQVYNADETGLYWRSLPRKSLIAGFEKGAPGHKDNKDRVTAMCCTNVTGSHKIPLLVIGKSNRPRCFSRNQVEKLPVMYAGQKSAWMDRHVFLNWYENLFLPEVQAKHPDLPERPRKVLLLLDNAPSHPSLTELNAVDESCQIMYLPPNVTSVIQPMDQGVIEKTKRMYRKQLLKELLLRQDGSIVEQTKKQTMLDCCYRIASAWNLVTPTNVRNAWNALLDKENSCVDRVVQHDNIVQIHSILRDIPGYHECTYEDVKNWIEEDHHESGWEILDTNKILERIRNRPNSEEGQGNIEDYSDDNLSFDESDDTEECAIPTIEQAFEGLVQFRTWFETRFECDRNDLEIIQSLVERTLDINRPV